MQLHLEELEAASAVQSETIALHESRLCSCGGGRSSLGSKGNPLEILDKEEEWGESSGGSYVSALVEGEGEREEAIEEGDQGSATAPPIPVPTDERGYLIPVEEPLVSHQRCVPSRRCLLPKHVCKTGRMCPCDKSLRSRDSRLKSLRVERDL